MTATDRQNLEILVRGVEKSLKKVRHFLALDDEGGVYTYLADASFRLKALMEITQRRERRDN